MNCCSELSFCFYALSLGPLQEEKPSILEEQLTFPLAFCAQLGWRPEKTFILPSSLIKSESSMPDPVTGPSASEKIEERFHIREMPVAQFLNFLQLRAAVCFLSLHGRRIVAQ